MKNACIINVGVNASHGTLRSPVFNDGSFEFVPIPEGGRRVSADRCPLLPTYSSLKSFTGIPMREIIPSSFLNRRVHNDPEFSSFTYGDYPTYSPRASNLRRLREGDYIIFYARLVNWRSNAFAENGSFYVIGIFEIEQIYRNITRRVSNHTLEDIKSNAHVKRGLWLKRYWDGFWVFKGSENSVRLAKAIPLTLRMLKRLRLIPVSESPTARTENQLIGSYMRAARLIEWDKVKNYLDAF